MKNFALSQIKKEEFNCIILNPNAGNFNHVLFHCNHAVMNNMINDNWLCYHLYQINKEPLKVNDYCYHEVLGVFQLDDTSKLVYANESKYIYKVIATTNQDISPKIYIGEIVDDSYPEEFRNGISNISQEDIDKFIQDNKKKIYNN